MKKIADHKILIAGTILALAIFAVMLYVSDRTTDEANNSASWIAHTQEVLFHTEKLLLSAIGAETGERAFFLTNLEVFKKSFDISKIDAQVEIISLRQLTSDNAWQQPKLDSIELLLNEQMEFADSLIKAQKSIAFPTAVRIMQQGRGKAFTDRVAQIIAEMQREERRLLEVRKARNKEAIRAQHQLNIFSVTAILIVLVVIFWKEKQHSLKKERERSNAFFHDLVESSPDAVVVMTGDGKIVLINHEAEFMFGYSRTDLIGSSIETLVPNGLTWVNSKSVAEHEAIKRNGTQFSAEISLSPVFTIEGQVMAASVRDITQRKKYEARLMKSEEKFRLLVSSVKDYAIFMVDAEGRVATWNSGAAEIKGYAESEIIGQPIEIFYTQEDNDNGVARYNLAMARKHGHYEREGWRVRKDKTKFFANVVFTALFDDSGNLYGYSKVTRDVTELKQIQEALTCANEELEEKVEARTAQLAASELRFRALIENSAEGISMMNASHQVIYRSPAADRITGGWPLGAPMEYCHPDDVILVRAKGDEALASPNRPVEFQARFMNMGGHYFWMEGTLTNLLHLKGVEALVTNFRDITARKHGEQELVRSEKIYKTIASGIPGSLICMLDTNCRYLLVEGDLLEKLGYSKELLLGHKTSDVLPARIYESIRDDFERAFEGETIVYEARRGAYDILSKLVPLKDESGKVYAIMSFAFDVTALKDAQRAIIQLNEDLETKIESRTRQLKRTNEELEAFSYSVSHDLRAPLRSVVGFSTMLEEDYGSRLDKEAHRITSVIKNSAIKMGQLIDNLLEFSRLGRQELRKTRLSPSSMVNEIVAELQGHAQEGHVAWIIQPLPDVEADSRTIRQVWLNLLSNALKYSAKSSEPKIEVGSYQSDNETIFYVRDNGAGFNQKFSDKLFKVFQRLHSNRDFEGTGVGLAIVDKIIARHGGRVWANGVVNEGATFYFSLPFIESNL